MGGRSNSASQLMHDLSFEVRNAAPRTEEADEQPDSQLKSGFPTLASCHNQGRMGRCRFVSTQLISGDGMS